MSSVNRLFIFWHRYLLPLSLCIHLVTFFSGTSVSYAQGAENIQSTTSNYAYTPSDFLQLTNEARKLQGVASLSLNEELNSAAAAKAQDMIRNGYWDHFRPPDQKAPWSFVKEAGYDYKIAGENLARGFKTPTGITKAWMASPTHRANLISAKYTEVGFACIETFDKDGQPILLTVQMFGSR